MPLTLYVLDEAGEPVLAPDPASYGRALLDPRRTLGSERIDLMSGFIWLQTEFVGVDDDGAALLWQSAVEWSSMLGRSMSMIRYSSQADALAGHAELREALQAAADALSQTPPPPL